MFNRSGSVPATRSSSPRIPSSPLRSGSCTPVARRSSCEVEDGTGLNAAPPAARRWAPDGGDPAGPPYGQAATWTLSGPSPRDTGSRWSRTQRRRMGHLGGRRAGSLRPGRRFSFYPSKNLGALATAARSARTMRRIARTPGRCGTSAGSAGPRITRRIQRTARRSAGGAPAGQAAASR